MTPTDSGSSGQESVLPWGPREAFVPLVLLVFRCFLPVATPLYMDWIAVFSVYWMVCCFLPAPRWSERLTAAAAVLMFGLYLWRTLPAVLDTLRLCL